MRRMSGRGSDTVTRLSVFHCRCREQVNKMSMQSRIFLNLIHNLVPLKTVGQQYLTMRDSHQMMPTASYSPKQNSQFWCRQGS